MTGTLIPTLETRRLVLRGPEPEDYPDFKATFTSYRARFMGGPLNAYEAWMLYAAEIGHWQIRGYGFFSLESKETGEWVGRVGPWCPEGWPGPEVGWTISPRHLRQGYATEAARASLDFAFNTLGWDSVIHCIMEGNEASIGVARNIGSAYLRTEQGLPGVCDETILIYGQDRPARR